MDLFTYNPMETGVSIRAGIMRRTRPYAEVLGRLAAIPGIDVSLADTGLEDGRRDYDELADDNFDLRLFSWHASDAPVEIHVYPNGIAMAEVRITDVPMMSAKELNTFSQEQSIKIIAGCFADFRTVLQTVRERIPARLLGKVDDAPPLTKPSIDRVSRTLLMTDAERKDPANAALIRDWLSSTLVPTDADAFISGDIDFSMNWVNYVVLKEPPATLGGEPELETLLFPTMRIAQYFWSAQQTFNRRAQQTITEALLDRRTGRAEKNLTQSRRRMRMLEIDRYELRGGLSRERSRMLDEFLDFWSFDSAVRNGELLIEASSNRIAEIGERRKDRSTLITDIILTFITFITGIGLVLSVVQYSREVMVRPVLEYQDGGSSAFLSFFAQYRIDSVLTVGLVFLGVFFVAYVLLKLR
ncbi:MAG: hypothetical protein AAGH83_00845 [Pseudomonadota bacterium]